MRALLVVAWAVGVFGVGLCQYPTMWIWIPALIGLLVGGVQAFALPPERQWGWIGATPLVFGFASLPALLAAGWLNRGSEYTVAIGGTGVGGLRLALSWIFSALLIGWAQRAIYRRWVPGRADGAARPPAQGIVGRGSGWGRKLLWSLAFALTSGVLVAGALTAAELSHPSSETAALGVALALLVGVGIAIVVLPLSVAGFALQAWFSRRGAPVSRNQPE